MSRPRKTAMRQLGSRPDRSRRPPIVLWDMPSAPVRRKQYSWSVLHLSRSPSMRNHIIGVALLVGSAWAGPLRFSPDTVCEGSCSGTFPPTTMVKNLSKDSVTIKLTGELSPLSSTNEVAFYWKNTSDWTISADTWVQFDSAIFKTSEYLLKDGSFVLNSPVGLGALDTSTLWSFKVGHCLQCEALGSNQATQTTANLGNGEIIGLIFTSSPGGSDTLYLKVNAWVTGAAVLPRSSLKPKSNSTRFSIDGKKTAPLSSEIQLGTDRENVNLR